MQVQISYILEIKYYSNTIFGVGNVFSFIKSTRNSKMICFIRNDTKLLKRIVKQNVQYKLCGLLILLCHK